MLKAGGWEGTQSVLMNERKDSKLTFVSTIAQVVEKAPPNGCCLYICPHKFSSLLLLWEILWDQDEGLNPLSSYCFCS